MTTLRKYGEAATINFDLFEVDGVDFRVDAVAATGDSKIMKDEGAEVNTSNNFTDEGSGNALVLTATEMQAARIVIYLVDQTATKIWLDRTVIIETYGNASAQHAFDLDTESVAQSEDNDTKISLIPTTAMRGTDSAATSAKQDTMETTLNAIPTTAMRGTDSAATSAKQDTMETTLNAIPTTAMRGTDSANTVTPLSASGTRSALGLATANMDAQFAASVTATGFNTVVPDAAGTAPTAIQNRQEMDANSVDLNAIISAQVVINDNVLLIDTAPMRGTDGANTTTPPTASAISTAVWSEGIRTITAFTFGVDVDKINGATVLGNGTGANLWRG